MAEIIARVGLPLIDDDGSMLEGGLLLYTGISELIEVKLNKPDIRSPNSGLSLPSMTNSTICQF